MTSYWGDPPNLSEAEQPGEPAVVQIPPTSSLTLSDFRYAVYYDAAWKPRPWWKFWAKRTSPIIAAHDFTKDTP